MFGVAFELYQGSGVAGRVAWLALVLLSPLGGVGCAPAPPLGVVASYVGRSLGMCSPVLGLRGYP